MGYEIGIGFCHWIKTLRCYRGMTQKEFGNIVSMTDAEISKWENGHEEPGTMTIVGLQHTLIPFDDENDTVLRHCRQESIQDPGVLLWLLYPYAPESRRKAFYGALVSAGFYRWRKRNATHALSIFERVEEECDMKQWRA